MTTKKLGSLLALSGIALCVLGALKTVMSAEAPTRVRIAYASRSSSAMPLYLAQTKGLFKAEALDVEIVQMNPRLGAEPSRRAQGDSRSARPGS